MHATIVHCNKSNRFRMFPRFMQWVGLSSDCEASVFWFEFASQVSEAFSIILYCYLFFSLYLPSLALETHYYNSKDDTKGREEMRLSHMTHENTVCDASLLLLPLSSCLLATREEPQKNLAKGGVTLLKENTQIWSLQRRLKLAWHFTGRQLNQTSSYSSLTSNNQIKLKVPVTWESQYKCVSISPTASQRIESKKHVASPKLNWEFTTRTRHHHHHAALSSHFSVWDTWTGVR